MTIIQTSLRAFMKILRLIIAELNLPETLLVYVELRKDVGLCIICKLQKENWFLIGITRSAYIFTTIKNKLLLRFFYTKINASIC